jgi:hypothetical protein
LTATGAATAAATGCGDGEAGGGELLLLVLRVKPSNWTVTGPTTVPVTAAFCFEPIV